MPSSYCLIYADGKLPTKYVLVGEKSKNVPNNPGQLAIFGGRKNYGESDRRAAVREFEEETGHPVNITLKKITTSLHSIPIISTEFKEFKGFNVLYVKVNDFDALDKIRASVSFNVKNKKLKDAEFDTVKITTATEAFTTFKNEHSHSGNEKISLSTDWFSEAISNLP